jgi:hypothetical protein
MKAATFRRSRSTRAADHEPTRAQLREIEAEWPLIAAEIQVVDAEIALAVAGPAATDLDYKRLRRANRRVLRAATTAIHPRSDVAGGEAA